MEYPSFKSQATQALDEFVDYARHSHPGVTWVYVKSTETGVYWQSQDYAPPLCAIYTDGQSIEVELA